MVGDAIKIVADQKGCADFDDTYEQILPYDDFENYYIWNEAQKLFEMMCMCGKEPEYVTMATWSKLARIAGFTRNNQTFKADLEIAFKNMQRKYECQSLDIHSFFEVLETLSIKLFR